MTIATSRSSLANRALLVLVYLVTTVAGTLHPLSHAASHVAGPETIRCQIAHADRDLVGSAESACFFCHHRPSILLIDHGPSVEPDRWLDAPPPTTIVEFFPNWRTVSHPSLRAPPVA